MNAKMKYKQNFGGVQKRKLSILIGGWEDLWKVNGSFH